jgi:hypothetical protein
MLHKKIRKRLHDTLRDDPSETRVVVACGLGGAGKSQLVPHYVQEWRQDYSAVFWIEAGQKETIEWDYLQIYRRLYEDRTATSQDRFKIEDAVPAVKGSFHGREGVWLVVLDSADAIDHDQDDSYIDLQFFVPDAPRVDVVITSRSVNAKDMTPTGGRGGGGDGSC